jgi:hypothetical protein
MKAYEAVDVQLHSFKTSALGGAVSFTTRVLYLWQMSLKSV